MAWWGKLLGGAVGLMLGGPLGALLGGALGHQFDRGAQASRGAGRRPDDHERVQTAFFTATFSVRGYVAKADGRVSESEIAMAEQVIRQMQLSPDQRRAAIELFNEGKNAGFPLEEIVDQFRTVCHRRRNLLQMFLEIQIQAALADGRLDATENQVLMRIADRLGFPPQLFSHLLGLIQGGTHRRATPATPRTDIRDAYAILGVETSASDAEIKKAYRRLMNQHHPDKLVARGLPEEMAKLATEKTQKIREAYERIRQARRSSH